MHGEDPEMSRKTARCSLEVHQRTEERIKHKKHIPGKLKGNIRSKSCYVSHLQDHHPLHLAITTGCHHIIPDLLRQGAKINDRSQVGQTALHLASETLNQQAIKTLLRCGAKVNCTTPITRETALHLAVQASSSKAGIVLAAGGKCVELLLRSGADVSMRDWEGLEALHGACQNGRGDIIKLLLVYGADVQSLTQQEESPLFLFLEKVANLRKATVLQQLLSLSYPLKLTNKEGCLPRALNHPCWKPMKEMLLGLSMEVWSLQDICKFTVRKIYSGDLKYWLKEIIPTELWNSIYINQTFSYASKLNAFSCMPVKSTTTQE